MTQGRLKLRNRGHRPFGWLVVLSILAYVSLPALYAAHFSSAHAFTPDVHASAHHESCHHDQPSAPEEPEDADHCDLCRMLGKVASPGTLTAATACLWVQPVPVGRVQGEDRPLLGCRLPIALFARGPPA